MNFTDREHNYIESDEEREQGHEDTRYKNFECNNRLGCNLGIDVAGQLSDPKLTQGQPSNDAALFLWKTLLDRDRWFSFASTMHIVLNLKVHSRYP